MALSKSFIHTFSILIFIISTSSSLGIESHQCPTNSLNHPQYCQDDQQCCPQAGCCYECCGPQCCPLQPQKSNLFDDFDRHRDEMIEAHNRTTNLIIILACVSFLLIFTCFLGFVCWRFKLYRKCGRGTTRVVRRHPESVPMGPTYVYGQTTVPSAPGVPEKPGYVAGTPTYVYPQQNFQ